MIVVPHLPLAVSVPVVDHAGLRIPHMEHPIAVVEQLLVFLHINIKLPVDQLQRILLLRAP